MKAQNLVQRMVRLLESRKVLIPEQKTKLVPQSLTGYRVASTPVLNPVLKMKPGLESLKGFLLESMPALKRTQGPPNWMGCLRESTQELKKIQGLQN